MLDLAFDDPDSLIRGFGTSIVTVAFSAIEALCTGAWGMGGNGAGSAACGFARRFWVLVTTKFLLVSSAPLLAGASVLARRANALAVGAGFGSHATTSP